MSDTHTYTVTVTNVNEPPKITTLAATYTGFNVDENTATTTVIKTYEAADPDANSVLTWDLHGADAGNFTITKNAQGHGELKFKERAQLREPGRRRHRQRVRRDCEGQGRRRSRYHAHGPSHGDGRERGACDQRGLEPGFRGDRVRRHIPGPHRRDLHVYGRGPKPGRHHHLGPKLHKRRAALQYQRVRCPELQHAARLREPLRP